MITTIGSHTVRSVWIAHNGTTEANPHAGIVDVGQVVSTTKQIVLVYDNLTDWNLQADECTNLPELQKEWIRDNF